MLETDIQYIRSKAIELKSEAENRSAGWDDHVKDRFFHTHIEDIDQSVDVFYSNAMGYASALTGKKSQIATLLQRAEQCLI